MDIGRLLAEAQRLVDDAEIQGDLRAIAFARTLDLLIQEQDTPNPKAPGSSRSQTSSSSRLGRISRRLGIGTAMARRIFADVEGELRLILPPAALPPSRATATQWLALLVAAGRQAAGYDKDATPASAIEKVCQDYGVFDAKSFTHLVLSLDSFFVVRGQGPKWEVKVKAAGFVEAGYLASELVTRRDETAL